MLDVENRRATSEDARAESASIVADDQHCTRGREDPCRVPAQGEWIEDVLDRLQAAHERERIIGEHAGDEGLGADQRPDFGCRGSKGRVRRLEPDGPVEPGRLQALEEGAVTRADVDRPPQVREFRFDPFDEGRVRGGCVARLLATAVPGITVCIDDRIEGRDRAGIEEIAAGALE